MARGMAPIHARRDHYLANPGEVRAIIEDGNIRAAKVARATMAEVRDVMKISHDL